MNVMNLCKCVTKNLAVLIFFSIQSSAQCCNSILGDDTKWKKIYFVRIGFNFFIFLIFYHIVVQSLW